MSHDQGPQLAPAPVNKAVKQTHREHGDEPTEPHRRMQKSAKKGSGKYGKPHTMPLQCMEEITTLERLLKHRVDYRDENNERDGQITDSVEIHRAMKNCSRQQADDSLNHKKGSK